MDLNLAENSRLSPSICVIGRRALRVTVCLRSSKLFPSVNCERGEIVRMKDSQSLTTNTSPTMIVLTAGADVAVLIQLSHPDCGHYGHVSSSTVRSIELESSASLWNHRSNYEMSLYESRYRLCDIRKDDPESNLRAWKVVFRTKPEHAGKI